MNKKWKGARSIAIFFLVFCGFFKKFIHISTRYTIDPDRARVYISGRYTGERTPVTIPYMPIGMYIVKLVGDEESRTYEVVVTPGEEKRIHAVFSE